MDHSMRAVVRIASLMTFLGEALGWVITSAGTLLGAAIILSFIRSRAIFVEARLLALALAGCIMVAGLIIAFVCRRIRRSAARGSAPRFG